MLLNSYFDIKNIAFLSGIIFALTDDDFMCVKIGYLHRTYDKYNNLLSNSEFIFVPNQCEHYLKKLIYCLINGLCYKYAINVIESNTNDNLKKYIQLFLAWSITNSFYKYFRKNKN